MITIRILASFATAFALQRKAGSEAVEMEPGASRIRRAHSAGRSSVELSSAGRDHCYGK